MTDSGSDRFVIQDRDGDGNDVQRLVQLVFVGRGLTLATFLVVLAIPISYLYRTPALAPGLMALAIAPLVFGFFHMDMRRAQRYNDFRTEALALIVGECLGLIATVVAATLTHNFTAIVYGLVARALAIVAISHLRAERRYGLSFSKAHAPRLARFAFPLMLNGLLLFFGMQGDRVVVGTTLGLAALGHYSAVLLLIYAPSGALTRFIEALHLPRISAGRDSWQHQDKAIETLASQTMLLGMLMAAGFAVVAPAAVTILYGHKFTQPILIICLIGVLQSLRFVRLWPCTVALGIGRGEIMVFNNIARLSGLPAGFAAAWLGWRMTGIVGGLILGEFVGMGVVILLCNRAAGYGLLHDFDRFAVLVLEATGLALAAYSWGHPSAILYAAALACLFLGTGWVLARENAAITQSIAIALRWIERLNSGFAPATDRDG